MIGPFDYLRHSIMTRCPDYGHAQVWDYIFEHPATYPPGLTLFAWQRPTKPDTLRQFVVWEIDNGEQEITGAYVPLSVTRYDGQAIERYQCTSVSDFAACLQSGLTRRRDRGSYHIFIGGSTRGFHLLFRFAAHGITASGITLSPYAAGPIIKCVGLRDGHGTVMLCDAESMTGCTIDQLTAYGTSGAVRQGLSIPPVCGVWLALHQLQHLAHRAFTTTLRPTIGSTALRVASWHLPAAVWAWKPSSYLLTMARMAHGYRAGYVYGTRYRGPAYQLDLTKAYTWALGQDIPLRTAPGPAEWEGVTYEGLFVCDVRGPGKLPIYVAPFVSGQQGFHKGLWNGDRCLCVLSTMEFTGLQALGYRILPHFGVQFTRSINFPNVSARIDQITRLHRRGSAPERFSKSLANALYGRLAEAPRRVGIAYASERPNGEWLPFLTERGEELPGVWVSSSEHYSSHQQVGMASAITARVRNRLYEMMGATVDAGYKVVAADTDGYIATGVPDALREQMGDSPGDWRITAYDENARVAGRRFYTLGGVTKVAGVQGATPELVEVALRGEYAFVAGKRMSVPWSTAPHSTDTLTTVGGPADQPPIGPFLP